MNTRHFSITAALLASSLLAVAQPAAAAVIDLNLESFGFSDSSVVGTAPNIADNGTSVDTSNANEVTTVTLPYTFAFSSTGSSVTPTHPLFVVEPTNGLNNTSTANIQVTFNFQYDSVNLALPETVKYYADANDDTDTLIWQAGSNGTCNGSSVTSACTYDFTIAGENFSIEMDNETDWNMAEFDAATVNVGPAAVPEPASLAIFGAGALGFGALWRRRRKAKSAVG